MMMTPFGLLRAPSHPSVCPCHACTLAEVAVDIVGKYSYKLQSANPDSKLEVPVIVDVELVGRTKVLRIHR